MKHFAEFLGPFLFALAAIAQPISDGPHERSELSLDGPWLFQADGSAADQWREVPVPSTFQSHEGTNFHGVGWYRKSLGPLTPIPGRRFVLHFQAAATETEVFFNGHKVGSHLGGWTPFRFDVTPWIQESKNGTNQILVRVDEKEGHNTQGFLPVIEPHFGGLWQGVSMLSLPATSIDDLRLHAWGNPTNACLELEVPLAGVAPESESSLEVRYRLRGATGWNSTHLVEGVPQPDGSQLRRSGASLFARVAVGAPRMWSPADPQLYELEIECRGDVVRTRTGFRTIEAFGQELRLNGKPLNVRGLLNWGYYPPSLAPNVPEDRFRRDLDLARACGFNLIKFCLWVPPRRFLDLADEAGMLTWMEYPTWHPQLTKAFYEPLAREFTEFFAYDRKHPSVILRSLTCETGNSAELDVIRSLYDLAHRMIPGSMVEDDSSWIGWNRVADFYDDHPYGNNHTWASTLAQLNEYILAHGTKPLLLGEAMAADTWVPSPPLASYAADPRPYWFPAVYNDQARWLKRLSALTTPRDLEHLLPDSLRYAQLMRKFQAETFRREVPYGGYVMSVIRDFPRASMGFLDYLDKPKWPESDWAWQRDTMCLLRTPGDARAFQAGTHCQADVLLSHFGLQPLTRGHASVRLERVDPAGEVLQDLVITNLSQNPGTLAKIARADFMLPESKEALPLLIRTVLDSDQGRFENAWPIWAIPSPTFPEGIRRHASLRESLVRELFPEVPTWSEYDTNSVVIAAHFDPKLLRELEQGARVLMLPDGTPGIFSLQDHWFLRGAPLIVEKAFANEVPRELLVDLQHFDLASNVIQEIPYLEQIDPILMLWDTHDLDRVKTHGLIFETRVGAGRLLVSAVRHTGQNNPAGRWLLGCLLRHLEATASPRHALSGPVWTEPKQ